MRVHIAATMRRSSSMLRVSIIDQMNKRRKRAHFDQRRRMRVDLNPDSCPSERASDGIDRTAWMRMHHGARQFAEACGDMRQYAAARGILRRRATVCGEACDRMEHSKPFTRGRAGRFTHPGPPPSRASHTAVPQKQPLLPMLASSRRVRPSPGSFSHPYLRLLTPAPSSHWRS
jgi:hypothetical protein